MSKIIAALLTTLLFLGCSSKDSTDSSVKAKLIIGKSLSSLSLYDQNEKVHTLKSSTKKVIFAFSKDVGHTCNDFFATKKTSYLADNSAMFIADVSGAPSLIRSMFIMPGLKDFKHTVLVLDDKDTAASYKANQDSEKIIVVNIEDGVISGIKALNSVAELEKDLQN